MKRTAIWISRFDWRDEADLRRIVDRSIDAGCTDLLMQARAAGDALYRSAIAPTSPKIADRLGGEPRFDPMAVVIEHASSQSSVRVHAWLNILSAWPATSLDDCRDLAYSESQHIEHLLLRRPDIRLVDADGRRMACPNDSDYIWISPMSRHVETDLRAVVSELCRRYPIGGIHLDRIRYPGEPWRDPGTPGRSSAAVTRLVEAARNSMEPQLELSSALVPDYIAHNAAGDRCHLAEFGQDGWSWVQTGRIDSVMPMVYSPVDAVASDDWFRLMKGHIEAIPEGRCWVPMFAGLEPEMLGRQIGLSQTWPIAGIAWYSAVLLDSSERWSVVRDLARQS